MAEQSKSLWSSMSVPCMSSLAALVPLWEEQGCPVHKNRSVSVVCECRMGLLFIGSCFKTARKYCRPTHKMRVSISTSALA